MLKAGTAARRRTLAWTEAQPPDVVRNQVEDVLRAIDQRLLPIKGDWVGHVKVLVASGSEIMYGSITTADDALRWSGALNTPVREAELTVYAAIYTLSDAQAAQAVDGALQAVLDTTL